MAGGSDIRPPARRGRGRKQRTCATHTDARDAKRQTIRARRIPDARHTVQHVRDRASQPPHVHVLPGALSLHTHPHRPIANGIGNTPRTRLPTPPASVATPLCSRRERGLPPHNSATPEGACRHTRLALPPRHLRGGEALAPSASNARSAARAVAMQHLTRNGADRANRYPPPRAGTSIGAA